MSAIKLTLSIPKGLLEQAKVYSRKTHQPLSQLVSRYFSLLARRERLSKESPRITAKVRKVTGLAPRGEAEDKVLFESLTQKYR